MRCGACAGQLVQSLGPGPLHVLWGTDYGDQQVRNAAALGAALPAGAAFDWAASAREHARARGLPAMFARAAAATAAVAAAPAPATAAAATGAPESGPWACPRCTLENAATASACAACEQQRGQITAHAAAATPSLAPAAPAAAAPNEARGEVTRPAGKRKRGIERFFSPKPGPGS